MQDSEHKNLTTEPFRKLWDITFHQILKFDLNDLGGCCANLMDITNIQYHKKKIYQKQSVQSTSIARSWYRWGYSLKLALYLDKLNYKRYT